MRTAVITGANSGIGKSLTNMLTDEVRPEPHNPNPSQIAHVARRRTVESTPATLTWSPPPPNQEFTQ